MWVFGTRIDCLGAETIYIGSRPSVSDAIFRDHARTSRPSSHSYRLSMPQSSFRPPSCFSGCRSRPCSSSGQGIQPPQSGFVMNFDRVSENAEIDPFTNKKCDRKTSPLWVVGQFESCSSIQALAAS